MVVSKYESNNTSSIIDNSNISQEINDPSNVDTLPPSKCFKFSMLNNFKLKNKIFLKEKGKTEKMYKYFFNLA